MVFLLFLLLALLLPVSTTWAAALVIAGALLEVVEVVVLRRWSKHLGRRLPVQTGTEAMIGSTGVVVDPCRPTGTVRIEGELWSATCADGADAGAAVRVEGVDELRLVVTPAAAPARTR